MKRYVLKKDLPTFKKGETFIMPDEWLRRESDNIPVYSDYDLENRPNILKDWFEEIPEEHGRWRADIDEYYWYLNSAGETYTTAEREDDVDEARFSIGNYFRTAEEAVKARDWFKAFTVLRDDTKGFTPNWGYGTGYKYFVAYDHALKKLCVSSDFRHQAGTIYFKSREDAEASIEKHEKEWLTFFGLEDEEDK